MNKNNQNRLFPKHMLRLADNNILHRRANSGAPKITFMTQDTYPSSLKNSNQTTPRQKSTDTKSATFKETNKKVRQVSVPIRGSERNDVNNEGRGKGSLPPLAMRSRIGDESKNLTTARGTKEGNSGFAEIRRILEQSNRKRNDNEEGVNERKTIIDDDYDKVGTKINKQEDREHVKFLDRWKLEIKRNKILNTMGKKVGQSVDIYRRVKETDANIPVINTDAINRIFVESDDDDDDDGGFFEKKARTAREYGGGRDPGEGEGSFKTVENAIQEHNQELINSLVMRKVKKQLKDWDYSKPQTQLKLQIKLIIETVLMKFKALKNLASDHYVNCQVEVVMKKMRIKRTHSEGRDLLAEIQGDIDEDKDRSGLDYYVIEAALLRNLENCIDETQKLAVKVTNLNHENFKVKKEISQYQDQMIKIDRAYKAMEAEAEAQVNSALERTTRRTTSNKHRGAIMEAEAGAITVDFLKMQKLRIERKKQEAAVNERISELQVMLVPIVRETENVENELKTARDTKAYYKLQLRDLYYKILKDEKFLVQSKSNASCSWIIRALWRINEEVKDKAFPTFMNHNSIKFMLDFAKEQVNVEKYCRQQNLIGMLTIFEDFKHINALPEVVSPEKAILEQDAISEDLLSSQNGLAKQKSAGLLMDEFKERMVQLKKVNLKAKRLVNVVQYNAKGRYVVPKWEEINPFLTNDELLTHISKAAMDHEYSMVQGSPQRQQQVDQEKEKLKVSKILPDAISDVKTPTQTVREMLDNLENMRKAEINRIIKENVSITLENRQKSIIEKTFLFLAGKTEGAEAFKKFLKEKKNFDDKSIKSTQTHKKSQSQNSSFNPAKNLITVSVMLQQAEKAAEKNMLRSPTNKDLGLATQIAKMNSSSSNPANLPLVMQDSFEPLTSNASGDMTSRVRVLSNNSKRFWKKMSQVTEEEMPQQQQGKV